MQGRVWLQGVSLVIGFRIGSEDQTFAEFRCRTCWRVIGEVWTFGYIQFVYRFHFLFGYVLSIAVFEVLFSRTI